jgi:hypothetical protein
MYRSCIHLYCPIYQISFMSLTHVEGPSWQTLVQLDTIHFLNFSILFPLVLYFLFSVGYIWYPYTHRSHQTHTHLVTHWAAHNFTHYNYKFLYHMSVLTLHVRTMESIIRWELLVLIGSWIPCRKLKCYCGRFLALFPYPHPILPNTIDLSGKLVYNIYFRMSLELGTPKVKNLQFPLSPGVSLIWWEPSVLQHWVH